MEFGSIPACAGEPRLVHQRIAPSGVYPACAGEPMASANLCSGTTVYPRVCGGTAGSFTLSQASGGLSPRVRGNPGQVNGHAGIDGSIPACAGEPRP